MTGRSSLIAHRSSLGITLLCLLVAGSLPAAVLDSFDSVSAWRAMPAAGVRLDISTDAGRAGKAMRLDFDFQGHGGYAIARRDGPIDLPEDFEFTFWIRGEAPVNTLEFKLIDTTGENVWWTTRREFEFPREWRRISIKKRQIEFAWGPSADHSLPRRIGGMEIVVTAGTGGKGTVWIDELSLSPLTASKAPLPSSIGTWKSAGDGAREMLIDLGGRHEIGGLVVDWDPEDYAVDYDVAVSLDGAEWETVRRVSGSNGGLDFLDLHDTDARLIRLDLTKSSRGAGYAIRSVTPEPPEWSKTPNDFFASIARQSRRGDFPRYFYGEQSYWTIVGADGDPVEALVSEDGVVELGDARVSIEPMVWADGRLVTWADVERTQSLEKGYLPIPTVEWKTSGIHLSVTTWVSGQAGSSTLSIRYRLEAPESARLYLAVRPFQVNSSWQFLARIGGVGRIETIRWDAGLLSVTAPRPVSVTPRQAPVRAGAATFDEGSIVEYLRRNSLPAATAVTDPVGFASAAMEFTAREVVVDVPLGAATNSSPAPVESVAKAWDEKLGRVRVDIPDVRIANSLRTSLAYILINRDGPSIQPGSRSYERSWIRDGSLTSAALLRLGQNEVVRDFVRWYAGYQYPDGKIPCCVSRVGADPVPENDSHGEFIFLVAEYFRYTRDRALAEELWPHVEKAVGAIDSLRKERMTPEYQTGDKRVFYGLLPESISHEGYSARPMHSYWDDLFALRGLKDAAYLARELGKGDAARYAVMRDEFRRDLAASIRLSMAQHRVDYIPGAADLGDFDATSTTVFLDPGGEDDLLPEAMRRTFEKYWENFIARRDGPMVWDGYTPYELRCVGALLRLGQKARAHEALRFFFGDQRPAAWNEWSEAVHRGTRDPGFIGDMPHTWVASDFIRSALDMIAWQRERDASLVIGSGVTLEWAERGVSVTGLRTEYGPLSLTVAADRKDVVFRIASGLSVPPGGIAVVSPVDGTEKVIRTLPAEVRFRR